MEGIIKGFQTDEGVKKYDYNALENLPDIQNFISMDMIANKEDEGQIILTKNGKLPISITGNAASADNATNAINATNATNAQSAKVAEAAESVDWQKIDNKPTTLQEYGLDDEVYTQAQVDEKIANIIIPEGGITESVLIQHNDSETAHGPIRVLIKANKDVLDFFFDTTDEELNKLSKIIQFIRYNRTQLSETLKPTDVIDNLISTNAQKPLSAAQGAKLKNQIDEIQVPTELSQLGEDEEHRLVTDKQIEKWNSLQIQVDDTLAIKGQAADAAAVGSRFANMQEILNQKQPAGDYALKSEIPVVQIDSTLSDSSTNPVQNKVIKSALNSLDQKIGQIDVSSQISSALQGYATETYAEQVAEQAAANLVNSAPETLDTLDELAAALGDDANFATTVSQRIGENTAEIKKVDAKIGDKTVQDQIDDAIDNLPKEKTLTQHLAGEKMILSSLQYGDTLPSVTEAEVGRLFFLKEQ